MTSMESSPFTVTWNYRYIETDVDVLRLDNIESASHESRQKFGTGFSRNSVTEDVKHAGQDPQGYNYYGVCPDIQKKDQINI